MSKADEKLNKIIENHNKAIVEELLKRAQDSTANITQTYLLNEIKNQVPTLIHHCKTY